MGLYAISTAVDTQRQRRVFVALFDGDGEGDLRTVVNQEGCIRHVTALESWEKAFCRFRRAGKGGNTTGHQDDSGANDLTVVQSDSVASMTYASGSDRTYNQLSRIGIF